MPDRRLYFDNAATSFPKPPAVAQAVARYINEIGASPGRGSYREAVEAARIVDRCRDLILQLINGERAPRSVAPVVFTLNASDALNLAIKGLVKRHRRHSDSNSFHVITSAVDHNSILRPLRDVERDGVRVTRLEVDTQTGRLDIDRLRESFAADTRLVALTHASNVTGVVQPIDEIAAVCRERNVTFLLDAAQTLGHVPIDVQATPIDLLAFPGHKGLLGPLGTGGLYLRPGIETMVDTVREGGTGSASERDVQPERLPDKYEPGSHNGPGIAGLAAGVEWILDRTVANLRAHETALTAVLIDGLAKARGVRMLGPIDPDARCGVVSFTIEGMEPADAVAVLEEQFGVLARSGLHCAPLTHAAYGTTAGGGAIRLSVGPFLTEEDARYAVTAVAEIAAESRSNSAIPSQGDRGRAITAPSS